MADTEVEIVNMSLGRIGKPTITAAQYAAGSEEVPSYCVLHYAQCRDFLERVHLWRFNKGRIVLASTWAASKSYTTSQYVQNDSVWYKGATAHTSSDVNEPPNAVWTTLTTAQVTPAFEYTYMFDLPSDYLRRRYTWEDNTANRTQDTYSLEGTKYKTNEANVYMVYSQKITDVTKFDPLFTEVLILQLAKRLVVPIVGIKNNLRDDIDKELIPLMSKVRQIDKQEQNTVGRGEADTWNDAYYGFGLRDPTKLGSN